MFQYKRYMNGLEIYFKNAPQEAIESLFCSVLMENEKDSKARVLMLIDGLEGGLEVFLKECQSTEYRWYDNGRWRWFAHYLPTLALLTDQACDIYAFANSKSAFSEGSMSLFYISQEFVPLFQWKATRDELVNYAKYISHLCVDMFPDGDGFTLSLCTQGYCFDGVLSWLYSVGATSLVN